MVMEETRDTYHTITKPSPETLFKERGSKFFNYAFPVKNEDDIKNAIESLKKNTIPRVIFAMLGN